MWRSSLLKDDLLFFLPATWHLADSTPCCGDAAAVVGKPGFVVVDDCLSVLALSEAAQSEFEQEAMVQ